MNLNKAPLCVWRLGEAVATVVLWHLAVLAALRLAWLARPDPFGQPLVGKVDWYFFHALAYDVQAEVHELAWPLAAVALLVAVVPPAWAQRLTTWSAVAAGVATLAVVVVGQIDLEVMRFAGTHLDLQLAATYTGPSLVRELPRLLGHDAGGPYVGAVLLVVAPVLQVWLQRRAWRRLPEQPSWPRRSVALLVLFGAAAVFTAAWTGATWKVAPAVATVRTLLTPVRHQPYLPAAVVGRAAGEYQARWTAMHPGEAAVFPFADRPLVHLSAHAACARSGAAMMLAGACTRDGDGDGQPLQTDCDDRRADVHPGAPEIAGDGVDQDCDGRDAHPWNFLVIVLESHRAMSVGHVPGAVSWSPQLDALAKLGLAQGRAAAAGVPTIGAFMAIHTGLNSAAHTQVATEFTTAQLPALPKTLRQHGYYARFFSGFDPAFDNQNIWLRQWYDAIDYDRSREEDAPLLAHVGDWLLRDWPAQAHGRPYFVLATTHTNHFSFSRVPGVATTGTDAWPDRMRDTMGYADAALGRLVAQLRAAKALDHTVLVVTGDHGQPLGEHGAWHLYQTLHIEARGVPLVFVGDHPKLRGLAGTMGLEPASHLDLAPTVLDLAGIDNSGAWAGRSLLRQAPGFALTFKEAHIAAELGSEALLLDDADVGKPENWQRFDRLADPREDHPLALTPRQRALGEELVRASAFFRDLYRRNAVVVAP